MYGNEKFSQYDLTKQDMTNTGNYNYGYAGAKCLIPLEGMLKIGDIDQCLTGKGCNGDNPQDVEMITEGYYDYYKDFLKNNIVNFMEVLIVLNELKKAID